jgi:membrane-bound ClpP family serine protease
MMGLRPGPVLAAMMLVVMVSTELALSVATAAAAERALLLEIDGAIGPPIADYIVRELGGARSGEVRLSFFG